MADKKYKVQRDEQRIKLVQLAGLYAFVFQYMHHHLKLKIPPYHRELYDMFKPNVPRPTRLLDIEPREYGKSIRWSVFLPLWLMLFKPYGVKEEILLISYSARLVEKWMRLIETELTTNPMILADFGNMLAASKVNNMEIKQLSNGCSITVRGALAQVRGEHPTQVIIDDLEDREEAKNKFIRDKVADYFWTDVLPTIGNDQNKSIVVIGTLVHEQGLLNTMFRDDNPQTQDWKRVKYSAIKDDGTPLWPERDTLESLDRQRLEMGEVRFAQEKLSKPVVSENPWLKQDWIQWTEKRPNTWDLYTTTWCDPAADTKTHNDYHAIVTLGVCKNGDDRGKIFVCEAQRGHWSDTDLVKAYIDQYKRWNTEVGGIEGVQAAVVYKRMIEAKALERGIYLNLKVVKPTRIYHQDSRKYIPADKLARAKSVSHFFEQGYVYFIKSPIQRLLVDELLLLPFGDHDDMADAMIFALMELKKNGYKQATQIRQVTQPDYSYLTGTGGY